MTLLTKLEKQVLSLRLKGFTKEDLMDELNLTWEGVTRCLDNIIFKIKTREGYYQDLE